MHYIELKRMLKPLKNKKVVSKTNINSPAKFPSPKVSSLKLTHKRSSKNTLNEEE